jgi:hypothetical protein
MGCYMLVSGNRQHPITWVVALWAKCWVHHFDNHSSLCAVEIVVLDFTGGKMLSAWASRSSASKNASRPNAQSDREHPHENANHANKNQSYLTSTACG